MIHGKINWIKGKIKEIIKLIIVSLIRYICVFIYTAQKQPIYNQKIPSNKKLIIKNNDSLIVKFFFNLSNSLLIFFLFFIFLIFNIVSLEKAKIFIRVIIIAEMTEEYIIIGKLYTKLNKPSSSYILCIVSSVKNKELVKNSKAKEKENKQILIEIEL